MPTYQYTCTACGHELEAVQSFSDAALTECPACRGQLRKVFSAVGVVFKGSGFYKTDSRSSSTKSESKGDAKSDSKGDSKSDSAPAKTDAPAKSGSPTKSDSASSSSTSGAAPSTSTAAAG